MVRRRLPGAAAPLSGPVDRRALLALLLGAPLLVAPARAEPPLRYEDFTTSGRLRSTAGPLLPRPVACGDETRQAFALGPGETVSAPVEIGEAAQLVVAGCRLGGGAKAGAAPHLEIRFEPAPGEAGGAVVPLPIPSRGRWWSESFDWGALAGHRGRLHLRAALPEGGVFYLRELHLRHGRARAVAAGTQAPPLQILLISVDTLRADAVGALGGSGPTPALDRLAAAAQVFTRHYAAASWTKPSHASLLTGFSPLVHGATRFPSSIHPGLPTLAERLRAAGFATGGLVYHCVVLNPEFGFGRGFDEYRSVFWELPQAARASLNWMAEHRDEPFFFFLHTYEAHSDALRLPYEGPGTRQRTVQRRFGVPDYGCQEGTCATERLARIGRGELEPLPREGEILRFLYGGGVRLVDAALGVLFEDLRALGLFERMLIVVTSDHGEALLEHANTLHGGHWNEVLQVPLLVKWPGGRFAGERNDLATSGLDVAPTLLAAAGLDVSELPGRDLAGAQQARPVFADVPEPVVISGRRKAVFPRGGAAPLLFDLAQDPGERHDLAAERPEELAELRRLLDRRLERERARVRALARGGPAPAPRELSDDERERLRLLGYAEEP